LGFKKSHAEINKNKIMFLGFYSKIMVLKITEILKMPLKITEILEICRFLAKNGSI